MKRVKLLFPLLFIVALAGSAFSTSHAKASSKKMNLVYYQDDIWTTCNPYEIVDGACIVDPVGYVCQIDVSGYGNASVYQYDAVGMYCYQPYYSYTPLPIEGQ